MEGFGLARPAVSAGPYPAVAGPGYAGEAVPQQSPTSYLQVTGMVSPDVLIDDTEYSEVRCPALVTSVRPLWCSGSLLPGGARITLRRSVAPRFASFPALPPCRFFKTPPSSHS